jgi:hypothetical protein
VQDLNIVFQAGFVGFFITEEGQEAYTGYPGEQGGNLVVEPIGLACFTGFPAAFGAFESDIVDAAAAKINTDDKT